MPRPGSGSTLSMKGSSALGRWSRRRAICCCIGLGPESQQRYIRSYSDGAFDLFELERQHAPRIMSLMQQYARLPMNLADASLVILAEDLGHGRILSTDQRDFHTYRWKQRQPFRNLLLEEP